MGDLVVAHAHLEQGIALYNPLQSRTLAFSRGTDPGVVCLSRTAWVLWSLGYPDQALARSHEAIALAQSLSHPYSLCFALQYNGIVNLWRREMALVKESLETTMALMVEHGFVQFWGGAITKLGWVLIEQGAIEKGIAQIQQGLEVQRSQGVELGRHENFLILAQAYGRAGQVKEGLCILAEAMAVVHDQAEHFYEAELYRLKGELLLQSGIEGRESDVPAAHATPHPAPIEKAAACFHQAITLARKQSAKSLELRAVMSLSRLYQQQGKQAVARQMLADIYGWFTEGFDTPDLQDAKALLEVLQ
jgi:predicted ATPase